MRHRIILLAIVLASISILSGQTRGQAQASGRIDGVARDPSGAALPGVKVTLTGGNAAAREDRGTEERRDSTRPA